MVNKKLAHDLSKGKPIYMNHVLTDDELMVVNRNYNRTEAIGGLPDPYKIPIDDKRAIEGLLLKENDLQKEIREIMQILMKLNFYLPTPIFKIKDNKESK